MSHDHAIKQCKKKSTVLHANCTANEMHFKPFSFSTSSLFIHTIWQIARHFQRNNRRRKITTAPKSIEWVREWNGIWNNCILFFLYVQTCACVCVCMQTLLIIVHLMITFSLVHRRRRFFLFLFHINLIIRPQIYPLQSARIYKASQCSIRCCCCCSCHICITCDAGFVIIIMVSFNVARRC